MGPARDSLSFSLSLCDRAEKVLMGERRTIRGANHETRIRDIWERAHKGDDRWRDVCFFQRQSRVELDDKIMIVGPRNGLNATKFFIICDRLYQLTCQPSSA